MKMRITIMRMSIVASLATLAVSAVAPAALITVQNPSFENPAMVADDGTGFTINSATNWSSLVGGWGTYNSVDNNFSGSTGGPLPGPADQNQYGYLQFGGSFEQTLSDNLAPNTTYTLTVAIGNNKAAIDGTVRFSLWANSVELAGSSIDATSSVTSDTFKDFSFVYSSGPVVTPGPLSIRFTHLSGGQNAVDNVRLDATPIPEPTTLSLVAAAAGLLRRRRH